MTESGFDVLSGDHPIVPVMIGDEIAAAAFAARLIELAVYAVSFSYPVVPRALPASVLRCQPPTPKQISTLALDAFLHASDSTLHQKSQRTTAP